MQLLIENLSHEGRGIATNDGKKVFVQGALPGETVNVRIVRKHRRFLEAHIEEVVNASADRVQPICSAFGRCGGCSNQHLSSKDQVKQKEAALSEMLAHAGVEPKAWREAVVGPTQGYRNKARLGVRYLAKQDEVLVGFREFATNKLAKITDCEVLVPQVGHKLGALKDLIKSLSIKDKIAQIEVANADEGCALVFRNLEPFSAADLQLMQEFKQQHGFLIYEQPKGPDTVRAMFGEPELLSYQLEEFGLTFQFHPLDFTQVNHEINKQMVALAINKLDLKEEDKVLDLFSGLGNFTLPIAQKANVVGVEGCMKMTKRAGDNAKLNNIAARFFAADLTQELTQSWASESYDKMLIDPPRSGAENMIPFILKKKPKRIVYVSCGPASFVRDAKLLVSGGYTLSEVGILDMFPHTQHVETLAVFDAKI